VSIKTRAVGLAATVTLVGSLFAVAAPAAHAVTIGGCTGVGFTGVIAPPLASGGAPTATVASVKTAKLGVKVFGPGFASSVTEDGVANCTVGANSFTDATVKTTMSGVASCDSASVNPALYPLNGKLSLKMGAGAVSLGAYARLAGFNPVPGPDVITLTGIITKGAVAGATLTGEVFFDPVIAATMNDDPIALGMGAAPGQVLKKNLFFDASQIGVPCGSGGNSIGLVYGGDGFSLLGSPAAGLSLDL